MTYWTVSLDGGPKRANQAAAALGHKIYSFGEYNCHDESPDNMIFGVNVLDTDSYRWYQLLAASSNSVYLPMEIYEMMNPQQDLRSTNRDNNDDGGDDNDDEKLRKKQGLEHTPRHRTGHTVVTYEGKFYMWGGCGRDLICSSEIYCFDPEKEVWSIIPCIGEKPPGRTRHTAVVFNDMMIIYGGRGDNLALFPESVPAYNFKTGRWHETITESQSAPNGREFHTACVIDGKMYVFGGIDVFLNNSGLDILNLETGHWETPEETGDIPCTRRNHSAWVHQGMMYIFGGFQIDFHQHLNTLHQFNPETSRWSVLQQYGLDVPIPRQRHCTVLVDDRVFLFGGLT